MTKIYYLIVYTTSSDIMKNILKRIIFLFTVFLFVISIYLYLEKNKIYIGSTNVISFLTSNINYLDNKTSEINRNKIFDLENIINYEYRNLSYSVKEEKKVNLEKTSSIPVEQKKPIVYIYNTHQTEKYATSNTEPYNIVPTVMTTSYMLKEQLQKHGIISIVEESSVNNILNKNKWKYSYSYKVTRMFLERAQKDNPSLMFYIDVHRDSVKKSITTVEINEKSYARIMLLLGLENEKYNENLKMIEYINDAVNKQYPGLSRGIYKKKGPGVNGVYNQDFSKNCILIEFGGQYNTIDEVYNTVEALGKILADYIGDFNEIK